MHVSNIISTLDTNDPSDQQLSFLNALHSDILVEIFSLLTQQECLMCMAVCRSWYNAIPQYAQSVWKELRLNVRDVSKNYQHRQQCLGSHVKRVVFQSVEEKEGRPLITLMQRLLDWGCNEIESLEFICCSSTDPDAFLNLLKQLASRLKYLNLERHRSNISIPLVLNTCPQLTHLSFHHTPFISWDELQHPMMPPKSDGQLITTSSGAPIAEYSKITYLRLDTALEKKELEYILERCPDLQCFIGVTCQTSRLDPSRQMPPYDYMDTNSLLSWCPKINSVVSNFYCGVFDDIEVPGPYTSDLPGLRYFHPSCLENSDQVASYLVKNQDTLQFLCIWRPDTDGDWSSVFKSLQMPNLRTLICKNIAFTASSFATMLDSCSALQKLDLRCGDLILDGTLARSLSTMHSVHDLRIKGVKIHDGPSMAAFFERFPALETLAMDHVILPLELPEYFQCPRQLKSLSITDAGWGQHNNNQELNIYEAVACFFKNLTRHTKLETIKLVSISKLRTNGLLAIAKVPTLKNLTVHLHYQLSPPGAGSGRGRGRGRSSSAISWSQYPRQRDAEFLEFVKMLRETRIENLKFYDCYRIPSTVLHALADLPLLKEFISSWWVDHEVWTRMPAEDLAHLLHKSQSLVSLKFSDATIEGDGTTLDREQLNAVIQKQRHEYSTTRAKTGHWMTYGHYNGEIIEGLSIKWLK